MSNKYQVSESMLKKAEQLIPLGTQTFSKSKTQFPFGVSPFYLKKGLGSKVWDVDGNEYIDFINGLASITLGYSDPDVDLAVKTQLEDGVIFSLPHQIEIEVAEKITNIIPCAEMVRFGKNGSDATSGAIRVARAFTKRDHIIVCGYHGWQDWYIGSTARNLGVPQATRSLTHTFSYNDLDSLNKIFKEYPDQIACVIMEAMNLYEPQPGFLQSVKELAHKNGALFILDEMVTGFRFDIGGAQKYFDVIPDLATFGKGIANGYPLSAVVGKAEIMKVFEEVFFSFTFGGETLSLAASLACMNKYQNANVVQKMTDQGKKILAETKEILTSNAMGGIIEICGHPCWSFMVIKDYGQYNSWQIKTLFMQEMIKSGILTIGTHNISYSHSNEDIKILLDTYRSVLPFIKDCVTKGTLEKNLFCQPLQPLFKVR